MSLELRIRVQNTVCRRVVSRRIHSIGTGLVERSLARLISFFPNHNVPEDCLTGNLTSLVSVPVIVTIVYVSSSSVCSKDS
jgi:hypothetical protein